MAISDASSPRPRLLPDLTTVDSPDALEAAGARPLAVRRAVVLAAGQSHRLRALSGGGSKALLRIGGLSLLERAVLGLLASGVEQVVVVVGHDGERVAAAAQRLAPDRVRVVTAQAWQEGNGASLIAAEPLLEGEPLVAVQTCDHIFSDGVVEAFVTTGAPAILVDERERGSTDEETKVRVVDDCAVAFGKHLEGPVIDCGLFLLSSEVFDAHRQAAAGGDSSLSAAVTLLAQRQRIRPIPVPHGGWWQDVDTPDDIRAARWRLRQSLGKSGDGPVSRWLNRPLSTRASMALSRWHLAPDLLSAVSFAVALGAAVACGLASGWLGGVLAGVLVQAASVLDGVDGETARLQRRAGPRGALLDGVLDRIGDAAIVTGLSIWALRTGVPPPGVVVALGCAAVTASFLSMAIKDRASALGLPGANDQVLVWALAGRDGRCLVLAISALVSLPVVGLTVVTLSSAIVATTRLWHLLRAT